MSERLAHDLMQNSNQISEKLAQGIMQSNEKMVQSNGFILKEFMQSMKNTQSQGSAPISDHNNPDNISGRSQPGLYDPYVVEGPRPSQSNPNSGRPQTTHNTLSAPNDDHVYPPGYRQNLNKGPGRVTTHDQANHSRYMGQTRNHHRDSTSGEESETQDQEIRSSPSTISGHRKAGSKLPPFTGTERWEIWFNRFSDVAQLNGWDTQTKLQELLPRLQGVAGEFVHGQLRFDKRTNYRKLVSELDSRFRVVETSKTYQAQLRNRTQKPGESPETYAAVLKRIYDKAYINRNSVTRQEDLTRKFLDGIIDERTRFHIEYIKEPSNIDEAVNEYVKFQETKRRPHNREQRDSWNKQSTRAIKNDLTGQ